MGADALHSSISSSLHLFSEGEKSVAKLQKGDARSFLLHRSSRRSVPVARGLSSVPLQRRRPIDSGRQVMTTDTSGCVDSDWNAFVAEWSPACSCDRSRLKPCGAFVRD